MFQSVYQPTNSSSMVDVASNNTTAKKNSVFTGNKIRIYQKNHLSIQEQRKNRYRDILSTMFDQQKKHIP
jgi:hypothetical protein